jgi:hypothetical protein
MTVGLNMSLLFFLVKKILHILSGQSAWGTRGPTPAEGGHQTPLDIPTINAAQSNPIHPIFPYKTHPKCSQIYVNPLLDHGFWVMFNMNGGWD